MEANQMTFEVRYFMWKVLMLACFQSLAIKKTFEIVQQAKKKSNCQKQCEDSGLIAMFWRKAKK